jgi:valyl-tRNA synthetase
VYITGLIRDEHGDKMSKSKGNILDPIDLIDGIALEPLLAKRTSGLMQPHLRNSIEKNTRKQFPNGIPAFGTDAVRFTFAALASPGRDIRFDLGRVEGYRNFCNKIWNAARYVLMMTEGKDCGASGACEFNSADAWIRGRLQHAIGSVRESLASYRFDLAAAALYEFTWYEFCDWYLEFTKPVLQSADASEAAQRGTRRTLVEVLEALLRVLHPLMPFITEEIWLQVAPLAGKTGATIMKQPFPRAAEFPFDAAAARDIELIKELILKLRNIRGENDIPASKRLERVFVKNASAAQLATIQAHDRYFDRLASARLQPFDASCDVDTAASALVGTLELYVPLRGLKDDLAAEAGRLAKVQERSRKELEAVEARLANPEFVRNAPAAVTAKARERAEELKRELAQLAAQLQRLEKLR